MQPKQAMNLDSDALFAMQLQQEMNASAPTAFRAMYDVIVADSDDVGINLPESALLSLSAHAHCDFPVYLKLSTVLRSDVFTHVASGAWSAPDGKIVISRSLAQKLQVNAGNAILRVCCEYAALKDLQKLVLQPLDATFCNHALRRQHTLNAVRRHRCLTENDIIQVTMGQTRYELRVQQTVPGPAALVCDKFELEIGAPPSLANDDNDAAPPIVSCISGTKGHDSDNDNDKSCPGQSQQQSSDDSADDGGTAPGGGNNDDVQMEDNQSCEGDGGGNQHTMALDLGEEEECEDDTIGHDPPKQDYQFSDADGEGWGSSEPEMLDEYAVQQLHQAKQYSQLLALRAPQEEMEEEQAGMEECNTLDEGQSNAMQCKPSTIPSAKRAWICDQCSALNNLLESLRRDNWICNCCPGRYRAGQQLIAAEHEDKATPRPPVYVVWVCVCGRSNDLARSACSLCFSAQPTQDLVTFETDEKPIAALLEPLDAGASSNSRASAVQPVQANKWYCIKCGQLNDYHRGNCAICEHYRWGNGFNRHDQFADSDQNESRVQRRTDYTTYYKLRGMATIRGAAEYPLFGVQAKMSARLVQQFGVAYRNSYFRVAYNRQWAGDDHSGGDRLQVNVGQMSLVPMDPALEAAVAAYKPFARRAMSIDECSGWMVTAQTDYLAVLQPVGGTRFVLRCVFEWDAMPTADAMRIRFVRDDIYVFDGATHQIRHYRYDRRRNCVVFVDSITDQYFSDANIKDIVVSDTHLMVLFDRWIGVYTLQPALQWYHAVAYSKTANVNVDSMEISVYDDWSDRTPVQQEAFFDPFFAASNNQSAVPPAMVEEDEEEEKVTDAIVAEPVYRPSMKNFVFINAAHSVVAIHPVNPTYDMLCPAKNVKNGMSFCVSRQYGMFWIGNERDRIYQSAECDSGRIRTVCDIGDETFKWDGFTSIAMDSKASLSMSNVQSLTTVLYDDGFGVSGRLLVQGVTLLKQAVLFQMFNATELSVLREAALRNREESVAAMCVYVGVYEMLYGADLVEYFLSSSEFNPVAQAAVPAILDDDDAPYQAEDEDGDDEQEEDADARADDAAESKEDDNALNADDNSAVRLHNNQLIQQNSRCLANVNGHWFTAVVTQSIDEYDNMFQLFIDDARYHSEDKTVVMSRFDAGLKYNEAIPLAQRLKETWKQGDLLLYYHPTLLWTNGLVTAVDYDAKTLSCLLTNDIDMNIVDNSLAVNYEEQAHNLYKLQDVVAERCEPKLSSEENPGAIPIVEQDFLMVDAAPQQLNEESMSEVQQDAEEFENEPEGLNAASEY